MRDGMKKGRDAQELSKEGLARSVFVNHKKAIQKKAKYKSKTKSKVSHDLPRRRMLHTATPKLILLMLLMLLH